MSRDTTALVDTNFLQRNSCISYYNSNQIKKIMLLQATRLHSAATVIYALWRVFETINLLVLKRRRRRVVGHPLPTV